VSGRAGAKVIDWAKLTPRQAWESLCAAPKVAGPWVGEPGGWSYRADASGRFVACAQYGGFLIEQLHTWVEDKGVAGWARVDELLRMNGWLLVEREEHVR